MIEIYSHKEKEVIGWLDPENFAIELKLGYEDRLVSVIQQLARKGVNNYEEKTNI